MTSAASSNSDFNCKMLFWLVICVSFCCVQTSPYRSKGSKKDEKPHLVYDQKQTGDVNVQLHLKDIQIIALLGDDSLSEYDYDYNYDENDFTIKPSVSSTSKTTTTKRPSSTTTTTTTTTISLPKINSTLNATNHPYPIEIIVPQTTTKAPVIPTTTTTPSSKPPEPSSTTESPGKIKVQIVDLPSGVIPVQVGIVPGEDVESNSSGGDATQGVLANYLKCSSGFTRDKRGRCRRVRKPGLPSYQMPFDFSRLASNLATKLKLPLAKNPVDVPV